MRVPKNVTVELECDYDLEGDKLYAIKWYKGTREFYRYAPGEIPMAKTFEVNGIKVDVSENYSYYSILNINWIHFGMLQLGKSTDRIVALVLADSHIAGVFSCEVSTDAPSFHTVLESKNFEL